MDDVCSGLEPAIDPLSLLENTYEHHAMLRAALVMIEHGSSLEESRERYQDALSAGLHLEVMDDLMTSMSTTFEDDECTGLFTDIKLALDAATV